MSRGIWVTTEKALQDKYIAFLASFVARAILLRVTSNHNSKAIYELMTICI